MTVGTNAGGLPYPNGDDPIRNGDNVIKQLADAVATRGATVVNGVNVGGPVTLSTLNLWVNFINNVTVPAKPWPQLATFTLGAASLGPGQLDVGIRDVGAAGPWRMARVDGIGNCTVVYTVAVAANASLTQSASARLIAGAATQIPADDSRYVYFNATVRPAAVVAP